MLPVRPGGVGRLVASWGAQQVTASELQRLGEVGGEGAPGGNSEPLLAVTFEAALAQ